MGQESLAEQSIVPTTGIVFHHMGSRLGAFGDVPSDTDLLDHAATWLDRCGIDAYNYGIVWEQSPPAGFHQLATRLAADNIATYIGLREMGGGEFRGSTNDPTQRLCAADTAQLNTLVTNVRAFLEQGAVGMIYLADDLNRREAADGSTVYTHCPACDREFDGEVANAHVAVLERLVDLHDEFELETPLLFCPPFYNNTGRWDPDAGRHRSYSVWPEDGDAFRRTRRYFDITSAFTEQYEHLRYFVTRFESDVVERYRELGARPVSYWANVPRSIQYYRGRYGWPDVLPAYEGFDPLFTGWIKDYWWDDGRRTLADEAGAPNEVVRRTCSAQWQQIRDVGQRFDDAWLCVHSLQPVSINTYEYPFRLWGQFCDDPQGFDPEPAHHQVLEELFGHEAAPLVDDQNEKYQAALLARLAAARTDTENPNVDSDIDVEELLELQGEIQEIVTANISDLPLPARLYDEHLNLVKEALLELHNAEPT